MDRVLTHESIQAFEQDLKEILTPENPLTLEKILAALRATPDGDRESFKKQLKQMISQ